MASVKPGSVKPRLAKPGTAKRPKVKRRIYYGRILWPLLIANLLVATFFSRATSIRHIQVRGVPEYDRKRVEQILAELDRVPYIRIHSRAIESEILREPSLRSAEFSANPFGYGRLTVSRRRAVAAVGDDMSLVMDKDGVIFDPRGGFDPEGADDPVSTLALTKLTFTDGPPPLLLGIVGTWQAQDLAKLAVSARTLGPAGHVGIQVDGRGVVCLNIGTGRVVLGSCDNLDEKLRVLRDRLKANPSELTQVEELNLTRPDFPAIVPRQGAPQKAAPHGTVHRETVPKLTFPKRVVPRHKEIGQ